MRNRNYWTSLVTSFIGLSGYHCTLFLFFLCFLLLRLFFSWVTRIDLLYLEVVQTVERDTVIVTTAFRDRVTKVVILQQLVHVERPLLPSISSSRPTTDSRISLQSWICTPCAKRCFESGCLDVHSKRHRLLGASDYKLFFLLKFSLIVFIAPRE